VDPVAPAGPQRGQPRSDADAAFLKRFDDAMRLPIIAAAVLPLAVVPESAGWLGVVVEISTWLVFVVDYIVHTRRIHQYRRTGYGRFDLVVVIATAPWFLLPGAQGGRFVVLLRLARLARLVVASKGARRLFDRLGRVAIVALSIVVVASLVAYYAERPTNPEFATFGDAMWWGIVTLTTVGYGDIVPKTSTGRWAGVTIMVTGIAVLGLLSGSLASFFRLGEGESTSESPTDEPATAAQPAGTSEDAGLGVRSTDAAIEGLTTEVTALRRQVEVLVQRLTGEPPGGALDEPSSD
jgi:voltage-gated potassium channel